MWIEIGIVYIINMGCCQSDFEVGEISFEQYENGDLRKVKTEDSFSDVSLDSHDSSIFGVLKTSGSRMGDSVVCNTRSTSNSLYRPDIETAFLHSPGGQKKFSIAVSRNN